MASASFIDTIFDTIKGAAGGVNEQQLSKFVGHPVDTVEQFMAKTRDEGPTNYGRGFVAGVIAGVVAVGVKMIVDHYVAPGVEQAEDKLATDMVEAAEGYAGIDLSADQESAAEAIIEVGMGAVIGGVYGLMIEALPNGDQDKADRASLLDNTKRLAGPALGLLPKAVKGVSDRSVEMLAGNAAFGATLEIVRRTTRYYMEQQ